MRDLDLEYIAYHWRRLTPWQKRRLIWLASWYGLQSRARRWLNTLRNRVRGMLGKNQAAL